MFKKQVNAYDLYRDKYVKTYDYSNTCCQSIVFPYSTNKRRKFSYVDDNYLLMALRDQGVAKDFSLMKT